MTHLPVMTEGALLPYGGVAGLRQFTTQGSLPPWQHVTSTGPAPLLLKTSVPTLDAGLRNVILKCKSAKNRRIYRMLGSLPDGGPSGEVDRELATFICDPDTAFMSESASIIMLKWAWRKNCPMTVLAVIHRTRLSDEKVVALVRDSGIILREDVSLPHPSNGCYNALHIACERLRVRLVDLLIRMFTFRRDLPRYDGLLPEEIVREQIAPRRLRRTADILELLKKSEPDISDLFTTSSTPLETVAPTWYMDSPLPDDCMLELLREL